MKKLGIYQVAIWTLSPISDWLTDFNKHSVNVYMPITILSPGNISDKIPILVKLHINMRQKTM